MPKPEALSTLPMTEFYFNSTETRVDNEKNLSHKLFDIAFEQNSMNKG